MDEKVKALLADWEALSNDTIEPVDRRDPNPTVPLTDNVARYAAANQDAPIERLRSFVTALDTDKVLSDDLLHMTARTAAEVTGNANFLKVANSAASVAVKREAGRRLKEILSIPRFQEMEPGKRAKIAQASYMAALTDMVALPEDQYREAALEAFNTTVDSMLATSLQQAEQGQLKEDPRQMERLNQITSSHAYLSRLTDVEKINFVRQSEHAGLKSDIAKGLGVTPPLPTRPAAERLMRELLGPGVDIDAHLKDAMARASQVRKRRDLGLIYNDPTRPGAEQPDSSLPEGFSAFEFLDEQGRASFADAVVPATSDDELIQISLNTSLPVETIRAQVAQERIKQATQILGNIATREAESRQQPLSASSAGAVGWGAPAALQMQKLFGNLGESITQALDNVDAATRNTYLNTVAKGLGMSLGKTEVYGLIDAMGVATKMAGQFATSVMADPNQSTAGHIEEFKSRVGWDQLSEAERRAAIEVHYSLATTLRQGVHKIGDNLSVVSDRFWRGTQGLKTGEKQGFLPHASRLLQDGITLTIGTMLMGATEQLAQAIDRPALFASWVVGEKMGDVAFETAIRKGSQVNILSGITRTARLNEKLRYAGRYSPTWVRTALKELKAAVNGAPTSAVDKITNLVARGEVLNKLHTGAPGVDSPALRAETSAFARLWAKTLPDLNVEIGFMKDLNAMVESDPAGIMGWKDMKRLWDGWRGKLPAAQFKAEASRILGELRKRLPGELVSQSMERTLPGDEFLALKKELADAYQSGDGVRMEKAKKAIQERGLKDAKPQDIVRLNEFEAQMRRAAKAGPNQLKEQALLGRMAEDLIDGKVLDDVTMAELVIMNQTGRSTAGMKWDNVARWIHNKLGLRMYSLGSNLAKHVTLAERFYDYTNRAALGVYGARAADNLRKIRVQSVYDYVDAKLDMARNDLDIFGATQRLQGTLPDVAVADQIKLIDSTKSQLRAELRDALSRPLDKAWAFHNKAVAQYVDVAEIHGLAKDSPEMWQSVDPKSWETGLSRQDPVQKQILKDLFQKRRALKRDVAEFKNLKEDLRNFEAANPEGTRSTSTVAGVQDSAQLKTRLGEMAAEGQVLDDMLRNYLAIYSKSTDASTHPGLLLKHAQTTKKYYSMYFEKLARNGQVYPETAQLIDAFVKALPDKYFQNRLTMDLQFNQSYGAQYTGSQALIELVAKTSGALSDMSPNAFLHEYGHHLAWMVMDMPDLRRLWDIFQKTNFPKGALGKEAEGLAILGSYFAESNPVTRVSILRDWAMGKVDFPASYYNQFTEWWARSFALGVESKQLTTPALEPIVRSLWTRLGSTMLNLKNSLHNEGIELNPGFWDFMADLFDGKIGVRESSIFRDAYSPGIRATGRHSFIATGQAMGQDAMFWDTLRKYGMLDKDPVVDYIRRVRQSQFTEAEIRKASTEMRPYVDQMERFTQRAMPLKTDVNLFNDLTDSIKEILSVPVFARDAGKRATRALSRRNMGTELTQSFREMLDISKMLKARNVVPMPVDVLTLGSLSFWDQTRVIRGLSRAVELQIGVNSSKMETLVSALESFTPAERSLLGRLLSKGERLTPELSKVLEGIDPKAKQLFDDWRATGAYARSVDNLNTWLDTESALQASLIESAHESGFIDDGLYGTLRRQGYNPHLYGIFERPKLMRGRFTREARRAIKAGGKGAPDVSVQGMDQSELMFSRDLNYHRVRFADADGFVYDKKFKTFDAARRYLQDNFGVASLNEKGGIWTGKTTYGTAARIAAPIGFKLARDLDLLTGRVVRSKQTGARRLVENVSPEARLERFAQLNRDLHIHSMLQNMRQFGMVLNEPEFHGIMAKRAGKKGLFGLAAFAGDYIQLPSDKWRFGDMGGKYVHRRLLQEINTMHHTYDQLRVWLNSLQDFWAQRGISPLTEAGTNLTQKIASLSLDHGVGNIIKTTQIMFSQATIMANFLSNFLFSALADGSLIMRSRNWPSFKQAASEVFGKGFVKHSPFWDEAVQHGVLSGALFDRSRNPAMRRALVNLSKLKNAPALEARLNRLQKTLSKKVEAVELGGRTRDIEMEIAAIEDAMQQLNKGHVKSLVDWMMGFGLKTQDSFGLPANRVVEHAREFYGKIDDFWKYATFINLRKRMNAAEAAWRVKTFMQNYAEVPAAVQVSGRSPFGALVPSFSYEMARITTNALRYAPLRLAGIFGSIAAVNKLGAAMAGVDENRLEAIESAMGKRDWVSRTVGRMTSLRLFDPFTHNLITNVDFSDAVLPLFNFVDNYSATSQMVDTLSPVEQRSGLESGLAAGVKFLGNFVGARPMLSWASAFYTGRDPISGRPLMDQDLERRSLWDWTRSAWHVMGRSLIPPALPGGRQFTDIWNSLDQPQDPDTGRTISKTTGGSLGYNVINALTNIKVRGGPSAVLSQVLGGNDRVMAVTDDDIIKVLMWRARSGRPNYGPETPMFGSRADQRELWARWARESDPERKKLYLDSLSKSLADDDKYVVQGKKYARSRDDYQMMMALKNIEERGTVNTFDRLSPFEQTLVLVHMDLANVRQEAFDELIQVMTTSGKKLQYERVQNPYILKDARAELDRYLKQRPAAAARFDPVIKWMDWAQVQSWRAEDKVRRWREGER